MTHLAFARRAAMATCVIGMMLPAVACGQTVIKVRVPDETSRAAEPGQAAAQDERPYATRLAFIQPASTVPAGSGSLKAASIPVVLAVAPSPAVAKAKLDLEPEPIPLIPTLASPMASGTADVPPPALPAVAVAAAPAGVDHTIGPFVVLNRFEDLEAILRRSKLLAAKVDIARVVVVDPAVCDVLQFAPRELSIVGKSQGATDVTFWFRDAALLPRTFLVRVASDLQVKEVNEKGPAGH